MVINVTLLYFVLLVPLSGFIAWLGDRIGHKTGKRRHSLFGLRPRHTAMVFTVGAGMCISLVSFALVWLLSGTFRIILRDGGRLYETNRELKHANIALSEGNVGLKRDVDRDKREAAVALLQKQAADQQKRDAIAQAQAAITAARSAKANLDAAQSNLSAAQASLADSKNALRHTQSSLTSTQGQLADKAKDLKLAQLRVSQAENRVSVAQEQARLSGVAAQKANAAADTAQLRVAETERTASAAIEQQKRVLDQQKASLADLQTQLTDVTGQYQAQKQNLVALNLQVADNRKQVADTEKLLQTLQHKAETLQEHQITYQVGEEVDRIEIPSGHNIFRVEAIVDSFLTQAAHKAEARGARKEKGAYRAVVILPHIVTPVGGVSGHPDIPLPSQTVTEDDTIRAASETIRSANTDFVVIASAATNSVAGEPVPVTLRLFKNPVVIPADTQIDDVHIDGRGTPKEISDALFVFRRDVGALLLHDGVIPASPGGDEPSAASVVNLTTDDWLHIVDNIRLAGSSARVVVTAKKDVRAGDLPLDLNFDVKGVPSAAFRTNGPY